MRRRHPAATLLLGWLLFALIVVAADCLLRPVPVTLTESTRVPVTVLPSQTPYQFVTSVPTATVTPREAILSTPLPTRERTQTPTVTPTPEPTRTPDHPPVQRG